MQAFDFIGWLILELNITFISFKLNLEENYTFIWPELLANKCQITYMHMK